MNMIYKLSDLNRKNFKASEFYQSDQAQFNKIDNIPKEQATLENLDLLADKMQDVRNILNKPVIITSGYRSLDLNRLLNGSSLNSYHLYGLAADFIVKDHSPLEICKLLKNKIKIDKLIASYRWNPKTKKYIKWTHLQINFDENKNRNYILHEKSQGSIKKFLKIF